MKKQNKPKQNKKKTKNKKKKNKTKNKQTTTTEKKNNKKKKKKKKNKKKKKKKKKKTEKCLKVPIWMTLSKVSWSNVFLVKPVSKEQDTQHLKEVERLAYQAQVAAKQIIIANL